MALKRTVEKIEDVAEKYRGLYLAKDGKFVLDSEVEPDDVVPKVKLEEFRNNNIQLLKERDDLKTKYKDVDPERYQQLMTDAQKAKEAADKAAEDAAKKAGEWDKLMAKRAQEEADRIKAEYESKLAAEKAQAEALRKNVEKLAVEQAILAAAGSSLEEGAAEALLMLAKPIFSLDANANPVAKGPNGELLTAADGTPLTPQSWVGQMKTKASYLFKKSSGGGAANNANSGAGGEGPNPWKKETWNLTKQGETKRKDIAKARQLATAAGYKVAW